MRIIANLTWRCQMSCDYCWVRAMGWHTQRNELSPRWWLWWLRQLEAGSLIDFSGGEPLMYDGIVTLLDGLPSHVLWAMTTNLVREEALKALLRVHPAGCVQINTSWHAQAPLDFWERVDAVRQHYHVAVNVVDHPGAPAVPDNLPAGVVVSHIPYQAFNEGEGMDGKTRMCNAGVDHLACDPAGNVYRCLVAMQKGEQPLGTVKDGPEALRTSGMRRCEGGCTTCYTDNPAAWTVNMEGAK